MCKLKDFDIRVNWYMVQSPIMYQIFARSAKDAEEIVRRLFSKYHSASSAITTLEILNEEDT